MPAKNSIKSYSSGSYYHLYNRGVEKRKIFEDEKDYHVFLSYLKSYLTPKSVDEILRRLNEKDISPLEKEELLKLLRLNNFSEEIDLLSYCLMPNHFHLLVRQLSERGIDKFMNSLCTRYTMYFNKKDRRVGKLFQGVYKAVLIQTNEQLLEVTRYIHLNPLRDPNELKDSSELLISNQPSSYPNYLGKIKQDWVKTEEILVFFSRTFPQFSYQNFVEEKARNLSMETMASLMIEE